MGYAMSLRVLHNLCVASSLVLVVAPAVADDTYARDPNQPIDQAYTQKIAQYTTDPSFNTALTDYLPHSKEVYAYFRLLEQKSPRVKVFTIGKTEEGRDMIAVAIADESLLADLKGNDARLAELADPRSIGMDDAKAARLVAASTPVYYITGTIHS